MPGFISTAISFFALSAALPAPAPPEANGSIVRWNVGGDGGWDGLTLDAPTHRLFVTRSDRVVVVDARAGSTLGTIPDTEGVHGVALDRDTGKGFTSNGRGNSVTKFDLASLKVEGVFPIPGTNPDAILFDKASGEVWTFNGKSHDATALKPGDGRVTATVPLGGKPEFAVSDERGRIFVNDEDHATLQVIDAMQHRVAATWKLDDCEAPTGIALDDKSHRLFSVCANGHMAVTDSASGRHVATVPIGLGPDGVAYDAGFHRIYSSNGRDGTLTVVREQSPDRFEVEATLPTQKSARTIALDPTDHRVYLAAATFDPAPPKPGQRPAMTPGSFTILVVTPKPPDPRAHHS